MRKVSLIALPLLCGLALAATASAQQLHDGKTVVARRQADEKTVTAASSGVGTGDIMAAAMMGQPGVQSRSGAQNRIDEATSK